MTETINNPSTFNLVFKTKIKIIIHISERYNIIRGYMDTTTRIKLFPNLKHNNVFLKLNNFPLTRKNNSSL